MRQRAYVHFSGPDCCKRSRLMPPTICLAFVEFHSYYDYNRKSVGALTQIFAQNLFHSMWHLMCVCVCVWMPSPNNDFEIHFASYALCIFDRNIFSLLTIRLAPTFRKAPTDYHNLTTKQPIWKSIWKSSINMHSWFLCLPLERMWECQQFRQKITNFPLKHR